MPYATNGGVRIHYEREGSGPPLVLHHGFTASLEDWRDDGYVEAMKVDYELILIDPRGHGGSDKPHDPSAYARVTQVTDVTAVLDDAGIDEAVYWGYSMGGRIGYGVARYAPERFRALIIGGAQPYAPDPEVFRQQAAMLRSEGVAYMVTAGEKQNGPMPAGMRARMLANDSEALAACAIGMGNAPSFEGVLASQKLATLIYVGDRDQPMHDLAKRGAAGIPCVTFISLPGFDHRGGKLASDVIVPHVRAFLAEVESEQNVTK